jgi:hypothetical protein
MHSLERFAIPPKGGLLARRAGAQWDQPRSMRTGCLIALQQDGNAAASAFDPDSYAPKCAKNRTQISMRSNVRIS